MRKRRLYPFTQQVVSSSSTSNTIWTMSGTGKWTYIVYKPNPFHGIDRWLFAFDEWGHRNLGWLWKRPPMRQFCNWWDRRVARP